VTEDRRLTHSLGPATTLNDRPKSASPEVFRVAHTPARCQSRRRRQHVIPDPQPSSWGSICQGMPLRRTKTMPVRHARSETRGRPPCGRRAGIGKNGSTRSHNGSGRSAAVITRSRYLTQEIRFEKFCYTLLRTAPTRLCISEESRRSNVGWFRPAVRALIPGVNKNLLDNG